MFYVLDIFMFPNETQKMSHLQGFKLRPVKGQGPVKNGFCPVKSLDGPTICPVVYAGKKKN